MEQFKIGQTYPTNFVTKKTPVSKAKAKVSSGPGLFKKVVNFSRAATSHLVKGSPQATDEQVAERFAICQECVEYFKPTSEGQGRCTHPSCGCPLKPVGLTGRNKLRWADQACPIGRWKAIPQEALGKVDPT